MEHKLDFDKIERRAESRKRVFHAVDYFFLTVWALIVLFPFYWMLLTSVKSYSAYNG